MMSFQNTYTKNGIPFLLLLSLFFLSLIQSNGQIWVFYSLNSLILVIFCLRLPLVNEKKSQLTDTELYFLLVATLLILYTILFSKFVIRSQFTAISVFAAGLFFISLRSDDKITDGSGFNLVSLAIYALTISTLMHCLFSILQYIYTPVRTTGMLRDFSQSAMIILLTFGLCYQKIRELKFGSTVITFILFLGFFTTFSRSVNLLLIIFMLWLGFIEYKKNELKPFIKYVLIILLACVLAYVYPLFIGDSPVSRGGFNDINTLNSRTGYWSVAWEAIKQAPFTGHGLISYEFTGIKAALPNHQIYHIHNDYLQILHDLGLFWFIAFIGFVAYSLLSTKPTFKLINWSLDSDDKILEQKLIAWGLLMIIAAYMMINFLIISTNFQLVIALIFTILKKNKET